MIKADELMIGDWIYDENRNINRQVGSEDFYLGNTEYFKPIQITSEILEKNGFKKEDEDCYLWNESLERIIWFDGGYTVVTSVRCDEVYEGHCYDVHDLQHTLKICGINKEIVV